jgi:non-specific protein-tyrosine kinase
MSKLKKALEKAAETRPKAALEEAKDVKEKLDSSSSFTEMKKAVEPSGSRREINIQFSRTKVVPVKQKLLRRNRIFSLFPEQKEGEQIKKLKTQILSAFRKMGGNTLLITSANPGEGKTFTSINLGVSIAQEFDRTVLLVDADMKKPHPRHKDFAEDFFGLHVEKGLSDYLKKQSELEDLLINPGIEKLTILPSGSPLANSAELLGSPRMEFLMNDVRERYRPERFILIDTPALLEWTDAVVISRYVDGILLVVEQEKTEEAQIKTCVNLLKGTPIVGTLLNKARI